LLGLDEAIFWDKIQVWLNPRDINEGLIKAAVFGVFFAAICTYRGYNTKGGAKGVGDATNAGVVHSMVLIIVANFFLTNLIRFYYKVMGITNG
jgi:phospholipid/cholesterol/gamma-HCH transport system permease protein